MEFSINLKTVVTGETYRKICLPIQQSTGTTNNGDRRIVLRNMTQYVILYRLLNDGLEIVRVVKGDRNLETLSDDE